MNVRWVVIKLWLIGVHAEGPSLSETNVCPIICRITQNNCQQHLFFSSEQHDICKMIDYLS